MESDDFNLHNLREWQPVNDVLQKVQRGFFFHELNVTCIDVLPEYLGLGSDVGIIFWYNRRNGNVQKLRTEVIIASKRMLLNHALLSICSSFQYPIPIQLHKVIRIKESQKKECKNVGNRKNCGSY